MSEWETWGLGLEAATRQRLRHLRLDEPLLAP